VLAAWLDELGLSFRTLLGHALLVVGVIIVEIMLNAVVTKAEEFKLLKPDVSASLHSVTAYSVPPLLIILAVVVCACFALQACETIADQFHRLRIQGLHRKQERDVLKETLKLEAAVRIAAARSKDGSTSPPKSDEIRGGELKH